MKSSNVQVQTNKLPKEIKTRKVYLLLCLVLASGLMTACGKNNSFVKGVSAVLEERDGEEWVGVSTTLNTGLASLPAMSLPIYDKNQQRQLMTISIGSTGGNKPKTVIGMTTNLSKLDDFPQCESGATSLPNGSPLPLADSTRKIYCIPIIKQSGRVYVSAHSDTKELMVGLALTIKELQAIGKKIGKIDLFLPFEFQNIGGVYGFFTSKEKAQSGLGLFFDLSRFINKDPGSGSGAQSTMLTSKSIESTNDKEQSLLKGMMEIQSQSKVLGLE